MYTGLRWDYRLRLWAPTSASCAVSAVVKLLVWFVAHCAVRMQSRSVVEYGLCCAFKFKCVCWGLTGLSSKAAKVNLSDKQECHDHMQLLSRVTVTMLVCENENAGGCKTVAETKYKSFQRHSGQHAQFDILHNVVGYAANAAWQSTVHRGPRSPK